MFRRCTLAVVACGVCLSPAAWGQQGISLSDRLNIFKSADEPAEPSYEDVRYDDNVQLTAAAAAANTSRSARNSPQRQPSNGLLGKFRLPSLFGGSKRQEPDSQPPMPYDESDVRAYRQQGQAARQGQGTASGSTTQRVGQSAARTSQGTAAQTSPTTRRSPSASTPSKSAVSAPRVVRNSPHTRTESRHNELAEALSGLRDLDDSVEDDSSTTGDATKPTAKEPAARLARSTPMHSAPRAAQAPVDVRDALLGDDGALEQEIAAEAAAAASVDEALSEAPVAPRPSQAAPATKPKESARANQNAGRQSAPATPKDASPGEMPADAAAAEAFEAAPEPAAPAAANKPSTPSAPTASAVVATRQPASTAPSRGVLLSCRQPVIVSSIEGPPRVVVGRTATYRVTLKNQGDEAARDVTASIAVPAWAEVMDAGASSGVVERVAAADKGQPHSVRWQLYELPAGASQTMTLALVARDGRPLQLGVQWTHAPVVGQAMVEVQEPKLHMDIAGPAEVMFGKSQRYTLTLANPGTGPADDVTIELTPPGGDAKSMVRHRVGALAPGQTKKIELELTARQAGELKIHAAAIAAGDLRTEAVCTVLCRKAELQVDWRGPQQNFAGAEATYFFRIRNPGTAAAEKVVVAVNLPAGCELIDASEGHAWDANKRTVAWQTGGLAPNEERFLQLSCRMSQPGANTMDIAARTATGDVGDAKSVAVTVEAIADLKLEVSDPKGVVPVGEPATYEVRVRNRGLTAARGVNVVAMFSEGIDPMNVEGGQHTIRDGRVSFRTIDSLPAGAEAVFRIHAQASQEGTHLFRAEVVCDDLDTKLSAEETTRFFVEQQRWADASSAYSADNGAATR